MAGRALQLAAATAAVAAAAYYLLRRRRAREECVATFERDGIAVVRGFASASECQEMMRAMDALVEEWDPTTTTSVFKTDSSQTAAQGKDDYFMSSGDAVHRPAHVPSTAAASPSNLLCTLSPRMLSRLAGALLPRSRCDGRGDRRPSRDEGRGAEQGRYDSTVKVAVLVGPQLATTGSSDWIGRLEAALRTQEKRPGTLDPPVAAQGQGAIYAAFD